ncbi:phage protein Gp27 family protein [Pseudomonas protegens]|uniref:phage protein Gp27 family protein n=1 Tax=Pseudomonas protegens TaxID=380021 RepID=UPI003803BD08
MATNDKQKLDLPKVAKAVAELGRASIVRANWKAEVRAKAEDAANQVEKIAKKGGLSAEMVEEIRREILGVAS